MNFSADTAITSEPLMNKPKTGNILIDNKQLLNEVE